MTAAGADAYHGDGPGIAARAARGDDAIGQLVEQVP
jgi:hypothetical protein